MNLIILYNSKQKFIEIMITYDIFSETMKSIINMYEDNIDNKNYHK